jgi:hypothetical protein
LKPTKISGGKRYIDKCQCPNNLLCDYATDAAEFKSSLGDDSNLKVRRNINPALLRGVNAELKSKSTAAECRGYNNSASVAAALCCGIPSSKNAIRHDMEEL